MISYEEVYKIGRIGKPHGVRGEVSLQFSDDIFDRADADFLVLEIDGILVPFFFEEYRFKSDAVALVKFCDIDTQDKAQELTGCDVYFMRKYAEDDEENLSWAQITGFRLEDSVTGDIIGIVRNVDDTTMNILFEIETADGRDILIPASEDLINNIDTEKRVISIALPEGILDL